MGPGSILLLIDRLHHALDPSAPAGENEILWDLVLELEQSVAEDPNHSRVERQLVAEIKAGVSFVIESSGDSPDRTATARLPLDALRAHVARRA